ncbi:MAG TPA: response regulator, partial [Gammaproteobacteria bacterium]|nr:response regulator [Gammaproteobacteria bacterium]
MSDTAAPVLVVDDEPDLRDLLTLTLEEMGLASLPAADLAQARRCITENAPRLVLTDMRLPDGDGLGLVEWMRREAPGTPVAVLTAYGNIETAVAALKAGAFDFLTKPLDLARLRRLVAAAINLAPSASAGPSPL